MKKTALLWLLAMAVVLVLAVLVIRLPAWATPLARGATSIERHTPHQQPVVASGTTHLTLQADTPSSDNCIACHTDKKKLKAVAKEPEEVKSEKASGEG